THGDGKRPATRPRQTKTIFKRLYRRSHDGRSDPSHQAAQRRSRNEFVCRFCAAARRSMQRRLCSMKWNMFLGALVVSFGLCSQSFGFELLNRMLLGHNSCCQSSCCEPTCCEAPACCEPTCCEAPACCEPTCCEAPACCEPACCDAACRCNRRISLSGGRR